MPPPPELADALRERLREGLVDQLADAILQRLPESELHAPVLRVEAFLGDDGREDGSIGSEQQQPIMSVCGGASCLLSRVRHRALED